jgi:hypothetical protein
LKAALPIYNLKHTTNSDIMPKILNEEDDLYNNIPKDYSGDVEMLYKDLAEDVKPQTAENCAEACWLLTTTKSGSFHVRKSFT